VWAVVTALLVGVLAEGVLFLAYFGTKAQKRPSSILLARLGGVVFYAFHHVGMVFDVSAIRFPPVISLNAAATFTLAIALMTGTVLVGWLLYRGGRAIGRRVAGPSWLRGLHGMKVALPYAAICLLATLGVHFPTSKLPAQLGVGSLNIHPSYLAAALWPLALGVVFGYAGGFRTQAAGAELGPWSRRVRGAIAGGWRMLVYGLVFGFMSLLGMAAAHPHLTRAYFHGAFRNGVLSGLAIVYLNALVIPNMAVWVLFPAMGTCVGVSGGPLSLCVLSYTHFPGRLSSTAASTGLPFTFPFPRPPVIYYAFVAIPVLAVLLGGRAAAKRSHAATREEAALVGALAGVAFALFALGTLVLATVLLKISGTVGPIRQLEKTRIGPDLWSGTLLALVWGVVGGAVGGLIRGRALGRHPPAGPVGQPAAPASSGFGFTPPDARPPPPAEPESGPEAPAPI
jgi:hypothetical protein